MAMTMEDKEKCAALYETFTGEETEPARWNEEAGKMLAEMADKIEECTHGLPPLRPPGLGYSKFLIIS